MGRFGYGFGTSGPLNNIAVVGGGPAVPKFISTWDTELTDATASATKTIVLPMSAGPLVDWGDGNEDNLNTHVYTNTGVYEITIDDTNSDFRFNDSGDKTKIVDVSQCDGLNVTNRDVFKRCDNLEWSATDTPNITSTNLTSMFEGCEVLNGTSNFQNWDVSLVTNFTNMFFGCFLFTGGGIENWDVGSGQNFTQMFFATNALAAPIGVWNMSSATNISGMFRSNNGFNEDLDDWNIINVQQMNHLFAGATSFAQDLSSWTPTSATTTHAMFSGNVPVTGISNWVFTSTINDMSWTFAGNNTINEDISGWNTGSATSFANMLSGCSAFDQDLTGMDFGSATNLTTMLDNCGMSTANYDLFLINLDGQTINSGLTLGAQSLTYTLAGAGGTARTNLVNNDSMSFVGDSGV